MLQQDQVLEIIENKRPSWVAKAEEEYNRLNMHVNGVNVTEYLDRLQLYENDEQYKMRERLVTSNRALFTNLTRPIDKVFNATGGNSSYPKKNNKKILDTVQNLRNGQSVKRWIHNAILNRYLVDPNGLIFVEWNMGNITPTVKSIATVFEYKAEGRNVEWVIFQPEKTEKGDYYRVVDEVYDYTYLFHKDSLTLIPEKTFKNPFKKCPAIVNSDILHFELDRKDSILSNVVEIADHYLRTGSIKNIYENLHGFPIFWAYGWPCKRCHGEGSISIGDEVVKCPSCDGKGTSLKKDVTDVILMKPPVSDQPKLAPDVAGYVQPDLETWKEYRTELDWLWQLIHFTMWGTSYQRDQETATATFIDAQPVNERLFQISESLEDIEQKIVELICIYYNQSSNDVSINWGKRFILESPDAIWSKYITAKEKGANKNTLNYLLVQFYESEYSNDKESLSLSLKLMKIEPFVHSTEKECTDIGITGIDLLSKKYYNEWVMSLPDGFSFVTDEKKLKESFKEYINLKNQENEKVQGNSDQDIDQRQQTNFAGSNDQDSKLERPGRSAVELG